MDLTALAAALGLAATATAEDILAAAKTSAAALADLAKVRAKLALAADAGGDAIVTAIASQAKPGSIDAVIALQQEVNGLKTTIAAEQATGKVDAAVKAGKVSPAAREVYLAIATENPARFDELMAKTTAIIPNGGKTADGGRLAEDGSYTLSAAETSLCSTMGWDTAVYAAERKKELN